MAMSKAGCLDGVAEQREAEAWKVAQLAVHIMVDDGIMSDGAISSHVATARKVLAESRRQAGAAAGGEAGHD